MTKINHMENIRNIIFDLGGVVIDLERENAVRALEKIGLRDAGSYLGEYEQKGPFLELEKGERGVAEFFDEMIPLCAPGTTATDFRDAFEEFLAGIPEKRLQTLRKLREAGYRIFVLSNTNPLMYNHWIDLAFRQEGLNINDYFDGIVTSFQEKTCKPDPRIFINLIKRYGLDPSKTLMLDDSAANCEAARSVGLSAIQVKKEGEDSFDSICERLER